MKNFKRPQSGGFRGGFKKPFSKDRSDRGPRELFDAQCSTCSKPCKVPFRPSGDRPVHCNECFNSQRDESDTRGKRDFGPRPEKRAWDRPRTPFMPESPQRDIRPGVSEEVKRDIKELHSKLDRILSLMDSQMQKEVVSEVQKVTPETEVTEMPKKKRTSKKTTKKA